MANRFGEFELDESSRTLALRGRALAVQPKVFDLLAYLVRHAGRVVAKQELLGYLWPDVHVSEGSLQRAVSLLRRTLREGSFEHALKSFSGLGYRFSLDTPELSALLPAVSAEAPVPIAAAHAAAASRDWPTVVERLGTCTDQDLSAQDHELWALALECMGRPGEAAPRLRSAVEAYEAVGLHAAAARCATTLAKIHLERAEPAAARGWLARASALLKGRDESAALAYLRWMEARFEAFEGRPEAALVRAEQAYASAEVGGAIPLRALTLGYVGFFNISLGRTRLGLEQQDHAAALAMSSAVDPITGGLIYCNILWSCRCFADWSRGHQWADGFEAWCKENFAGTTGSCELHRAEVLGARATLPEALSAVDVALAKLPSSEPWALGDAYRVRGDLRAACGDLEAAREDYRNAYAAGWDAEPGNAVLLSEQGDVEGALSALDRVLASVGWFGLQRRAWILAHKARICARAGRTDEARACIEILTSSFDGWPSSAIHALVTEAQAFLTSDERAERPSAIQFLTLARQLWTSIGVEHQAARVRLELAKMLLARGDRAGARVELTCAEESAKRVGARLLEQQATSLAVSMSDAPGNLKEEADA